MIPVSAKRLVIAHHRVDYRKQWNGLLGECYRMGFDPYEGDCVVFVKGDKTQLRIMFGDHRGLFLVARRFDGGCLRLGWIFKPSAAAEPVTAAEVAMLLEGATFTVERRVKKWRKNES